MIGLVDLKNKPEWFTTIVNPFTKACRFQFPFHHSFIDSRVQEVPALAYGGPVVPADQPSSESIKLTESLVILEFLADIDPSAKLLPSDPVQRAKSRFFIERMNATLRSAFLAFHQQGSKEALLDAFKVVQSLLPETGFAIGEWSIADANTAPFLARFEVVMREDLGPWEKGVGRSIYEKIFAGEDYARLVRYLRDNQARDSWKKTWNEVGLCLIDWRPAAHEIT